MIKVGRHLCLYMQYLGEIISFAVTFSWTATALFAEVASKRLGALQLNVIRMFLSLVLLSITMLCVTGFPYPLFCNPKAWLWLSLSGFVGYVFGDWCLFNSYVIIGSRFGQLFMTLASVFAALSGYILLGEHLSLLVIIGILVTITGIGMSVLNKGGDEEKHKLNLKLPVKGVLLGIGAAMGQGIGLVLSKMGIDAYEQSVPANASSVLSILPFASTFIRAITGTLCFLCIMGLQKKFHTLPVVIKDGKGMKAALGATLFGPFIGVSFSLMAIQYTETGIAQTIMALTPVFILLPSALIFHQKITVKEVIGAIVSVIGVSLFFL